MGTDLDTASTNSILHSIRDELYRARVKFPDQSAQVTFIGLMEEVGELSEAYLDAYVLDPKHRKGKTYADLRKEAVQAAVMAIRIVLDCGLQGG